MGEHEFEHESSSSLVLSLQVVYDEPVREEYQTSPEIGLGRIERGSFLKE